MDDSANQVRIVAEVFRLHGVNYPQQFLGNMGQGDPMRFPLSPLFGIVFGKDGFMSNERETAVHQGISELR